jgi:hypothetical protein
MRGLYTTLYLRAHFYLSPFDLEGLRTSAVTLVLRVRYNDGFIAYLDGTQIARENVAGAGVPAAFDAKAQGAHTGEARIVLDALLPILSAGAHTLSVQGVNDALSSDAFLLDAQLALEPILPAPLAETPADLVINEVWPDDAGSAGFIEVYNRGDVQLSLDGFAIVDSAGGRRPLPTGLVVPARTPLAVTESQLGLAIAPAGSTYVLVRSGAPGLADDFVDVFVDALGTRAAGPSLSYGRYPDGAEGNGFALDAATPGGANVLTRMTSVVIHEIHFHPPYAPPSATCARRCSDALQWIELHNQSAAPVDLTGWSLSKAVKLDLPAALVPPGGYLIVAADRDAFLENHPGFDPQGVVGSWDGHLSHSSDEIHLNDARGNRADSVHYGDGGPVNDLDPEDGVDDGTFAGSDWPVGADGTGRSIELMHPILDNSAGAAWREGPLGGTPGMSNASFTETPPPTIDRVEQSPPLPSALDPVKITCKVSAVGAVSLVELSWRVEGSAGASAKITLRDDGLSGDGGAGDGVYGGVIPPQANGAVVGFTLRARLADGRETTAPAQPAIPPYPGSTGARFLYQVLAPGLSSSSLERCWIVLSPEDLAELQARPLESDILLPCTFIGSRRQGEWEVHYLAGLRYRGSQTREAIHKPYRVEFPAEDRYRGIRHLDLNSVKASREILAADLFWRAGVPTPAATLVQLTFEGGSELLYARKEHVDEEFVDRYFGKGSDSGNLYRAIHPENELRSGNLEYFGPDPAEYLPFYSPRSNEEDSDLSEIVELCRAFNPSETPDDVFPAALDSLIDVGEWIRFFALQTLTANEDGGIHSLVGDDYFLYRVPADSDRPDAGKWLLLPWDLEETFLNSKQRLFYSQMPSVRRLLFHPRYAAQYYRELTSLRGGDFSRVEMKKRMMLLEPFGFSDTDSIDTFLAERLGFLDATIPLGISAGPGVSTISPPPALLVKAGAPWKYWKGSSEPAGGALAWTSLGYDDSAWAAGPSGIGYGGGDDATVLPDMKGAYSSVFARQVFDAAEPAALRSLELLIAYDDGFVAYLNGAEVARRNVPGVAGAPVPRDALASAAHAGGRPEAIDITSQRSKLVPGPNVLAIQVFNHELDSDGLTLLPQLGETGAADLGEAAAPRFSRPAVC